MYILIDLFLTFTKIGLFTFGGGYAMIAMIENICVENKQWISHEELMDITVIAESTPGPIAINCATYTGYKKAGYIGAVMTTLGITLPSFLVIYLISIYFNNFLEYTIIAKAFSGIKIAVGILILQAAIEMVKKMGKKRFPRMIMIFSLITMLCSSLFSLNCSSIGLMVLCGSISLILFIVKNPSLGKRRY